MDDDIVLNIAVDNSAPKRTRSVEKGGRWMDRAKAKRNLKRKDREVEKPLPVQGSSTTQDSSHRPAKRLRSETVTQPSASTPESPQKSSASTQSRPTQVISSLFSYNPKVELPKQAASTVPSKPSNAPLDSSTFEGLTLNPLLIAHLKSKMGIEKPTAIQRATLPLLLSQEPSLSSRDAFIQSQTGSGKTMSYLLPIINDLLPLSSLSYIDRSIGTLAIIIAPTRELAKQISDVLEAVLKMRLRLEDNDTTEPDTSTQLTRWLVSGLLVGGSTRTHEKARLRKGVPILVSTPGRLLDHLQNTSSFNVGKCRWLVLDEADQLMELGFEEAIKGIVQGLDGRRRLAKQAMEEGRSTEVGTWDWEKGRRTVLCSATIREDVQKLAGTTLVNPLMIKATEIDKDDGTTKAIDADPANKQTFTPPSQLSQKYVVVPLKLRLVTLVALLRNLVAQTQVRKGSKIIVFFSCTDSVDFHWNLLKGSRMGNSSEEEEETNENSDEDKDDSDEDTPNSNEKTGDLGVETQSALLPGTSIYRLHGSLPTPTRLASLKGFIGKQNKNKTVDESLTSILLCTSVAARGLDLPLVRAVIQYDLPTEGGATEYVHRVGRTARAGKGGEAWSFVAPSENAWVEWLEAKLKGDGDKSDKISLSGVAPDEVLSSGFGGRGAEYEARATEVQLAFERWVLRGKDNAKLAKNAFLSHMRAYATHPSNEKHIFHIRNLHLGHLAKAFALRDAPKAVKGAGAAPKKKKILKTYKSITKPQNKVSGHRKKGADSDDEDSNVIDAEKRMQVVVRAQGRLTKKGGLMTSTGASEFQISGGYDLEKLVNR
ncbi:ATP-dependent RNA helicase DBP7 [Panaeolus papilionaceus]|nr:ATP-dependent RNA helicase DBP7 [Panaeolus papilionaceus]